MKGEFNMQNIGKIKNENYKEENIIYLLIYNYHRIPLSYHPLMQIPFCKVPIHPRKVKHKYISNNKIFLQFK